MAPTFRASMHMMHSWAGLLLGGLLFAIFWMGSLSVFDREIDRWMAPMTRLPSMERHISLDALRPSLADAIAAKSPLWSVVLPTDREPMLRVVYRSGSALSDREFDPATLEPLPDRGTWAGSGFLYPFHYMLHIRFAELGTWLVGLAGIFMLAMCASGVIIHRRLAADFFWFSPRAKPARTLVELHKVVGTIGLPFHAAIAFSGLTIFAATYFPTAWQPAYQSEQSYAADAAGSFIREASGRPGGPIASLDAMAGIAERSWGGGEASYVQVRLPGDLAASVAIGRSSADRVALIGDAAWFDAGTGRLIRERHSGGSVGTARAFIEGVHLLRFNNWTLRWLYFVLGLSGCVLIATGYLYWLESRRRKHAQLGLPGVRVVEGLAIGSVTGIILATLAFFVANRLLPLRIGFAGFERAALEVWAFYLTWLATFAHAWMRPRRAWIDQCRAIAVLAVAAVLLNWITTGDHLIRSLAHHYLWPIAGMDLMLIVGGGGAALIAFRLARRVAEPSADRVRPAPQPEPQAAE